MKDTELSGIATSHRATQAALVHMARAGDGSASRRECATGPVRAAVREEEGCAAWA